LLLSAGACRPAPAAIDGYLLPEQGAEQQTRRC